MTAARVVTAGPPSVACVRALMRWGPVRTRRRCRPTPRSCRRRCRAVVARPASTRTSRRRRSSPKLVEFAPAQRAVVRRRREARAGIQLPDGAVIDSTDMDHWTFPGRHEVLQGVRARRQAARDAPDLARRRHRRSRARHARRRVRVERRRDRRGVRRRTARRTCAAPITTRRRPTPAGTVTSARPGTSLGLSALQLGDVSALPLSAPPGGTTFAAPNPALGYLHANCGHCHNPNGSAWVDSHMILRLDVDEHDAAATQIVQTTVGVAARAVDRPRLHETDRRRRSRPERAVLSHDRSVR